MKRASRLLVVATGILALSGCKRLRAIASQTGDSGAAAPASSAGSGQQVARGLYRMTLDGVRQCPPTRFEQPKKGHIWLGVEVELQAVSTTAVPVNAFYARLTDSDGHRYRARFDGCSPALAHTPLSGGATAYGVVGFEIPEHASGLSFDYDPHVPGHPRQEVRFDLGR